LATTFAACKFALLAMAIAYLVAALAARLSDSGAQEERSR
jgi:hypothetical protein